MTKIKQASTETTVRSVYDKIVLTLVFICLCFQGGFYSGCIIAVCFIMTLICTINKIYTSKISVFPLLFCIWYFICSIKNGFILENVSKGLIPYGVFIFSLGYACIVTDKVWFKTTFLKISLVFAVISIGEFIVNSVRALSICRTILPFGYSNASGIFFGVLFMLSYRETNTILKWGKYVYALALLFTQSIGAIVITVVAYIFTDIKNKRNIIFICCTMLLIVIMKDRVYESIFTFTERLLQMRDGMNCISHNFFFGIGAGNWEIEKPMYQSGFYTAKLIHSGVIQIGVDSGIVGLTLFLVTIVQFMISLFRVDRYRFVCATMLVIHSCVDLTFSYLSLGILFAMILYASSSDNVIIKNTHFVYRVCLAGITVFIFFMGVANIESKNMHYDLFGKKYSKVIFAYENEVMPHYSKSCTDYYISALCMVEDYKKIINVLDNAKFKSTPMYILESEYNKYMDLCDVLKEQPYNTYFYEEIQKHGSSVQKKQANKIKLRAIKEMSLIGKILYSKKGENYR